VVPRVLATRNPSTILKVAKYGRSPFVTTEIQKNYSVSKSTDELYSMVCQHGYKTLSQNNEEVVIDYDTFYCNLGHLVDSVKPRHQAWNLVAEIGIHVIKEENKNPKKYIMPLRVSVSNNPSFC
jgi:hypothetical protein